jgi:phosphoserine phosphatase
MNFALVFIAEHLNTGHLAQIQSWCDDHHIRFSIKPRWLSEHKAAEILVDDTPRPEQWESLKTLLSPLHIDVLMSPVLNRRKSILLADMDSTMVTTETLDELSHAIGLKDKVSNITQRAMNGEINFYHALRERVMLLKGLSLDIIQDVVNATHLHEGAVELVQTMKFYGAKSALISSGFTHFTAPIAAQIGFDYNHGNEFVVENNSLSGDVVEPIQDKDTKLRLLREYAETMNITIDKIIAVGDGANDIPMLSAAGLGIGYYPKPIVAKTIQQSIQFTNLKSLLYIQGYSDLDIAVAMSEYNRKTEIQ